MNSISEDGVYDAVQFKEKYKDFSSKSLSAGVSIFLSCNNEFINFLKHQKLSPKSKLTWGF